MNDLTKIVQNALNEDMPNGDITTDNLFKDEQSVALFIAKAPGIVSGVLVAYETFKQVDSTLELNVFYPMVQG